MTNTTKINGTEYVTVEQLAKIYKCSEQTVYNALKKRTKKHSFVLDNAVKTYWNKRQTWLIPYLDIPTFYRKNVQTDNH